MFCGKEAFSKLTLLTFPVARNNAPSFLAHLSLTSPRRTAPPLVGCRLHLDAPPDLTPPDESPVALHSPAEGNLLPDAGAHGRRQPDLGQVGLDCDHAPARREGTNVDHEHLLLPEL